MQVLYLWSIAIIDNNNNSNQLFVVVETVYVVIVKVYFVIATVFSMSQDAERG